MKLEIDLNEILNDEYGSSENLAESIRRQVVEKVTEKAQAGVEKQISVAVATAIKESLEVAVKEQMPALVSDLMNAEYRPINCWGDTEKEKTTFRTQLVKHITSNLGYKKAAYDSDKNPFTRAVDEAVKANVNAMQKDFDTRVCEMFQKEAFEYAMKKMAEKLGVKLQNQDLVK